MVLWFVFRSGTFILKKEANQTEPLVYVRHVYTKNKIKYIIYLYNKFI